MVVVDGALRGIHDHTRPAPILVVVINSFQV